jgi:hypothetical protein
MKPKRKTTSHQSVAETVRMLREIQTGRSEDPFLKERVCHFCGQVKRSEFYVFVGANVWSCMDCFKERQETQ